MDSDGLALEGSHLEVVQSTLHGANNTEALLASDNNEMKRPDTTKNQ